MTRGAAPTYANTVYAQWIKQELEARGWDKQDLAREVARLSEARMSEDSAYRLVIRVTKEGRDSSPDNRALIADALESPPSLTISTDSPEVTLAKVLVRLGRVEVALGSLGGELQRIGGLVDQATHEVQQVPPRTLPKGRRKK